MASETRVNLYNVAIPGVANTNLRCDVVAVFDAASSGGQANSLQLEYAVVRTSTTPATVIRIDRDTFLDIKLVKGI